MFKSRDKFNSTYHATQSSWRSPTVELNEKSFNEGNRFFTHKKQHGVRYIVPPKAEYLSQLQEEQKFHDDKAKIIKNTLLSDTYSYKSRANSERYGKKNSFTQGNIV
jgi:hypothetical protein